MSIFSLARRMMMSVKAEVVTVVILRVPVASGYAAASPRPPLVHGVVLICYLLIGVRLIYVASWEEISRSGVATVVSYTLARLSWIYRLGTATMCLDN